MKTHFKKLKNTNYLGSWDLANDDGTFKEAIVTMENTKKEIVFDGQGGKEDLPVLRFKGIQKPMVMNATNLKQVAKITGSAFVEDWEGKQICLFVQKVKAFGEWHDALRIKAPVAPQKHPLPKDRFDKAIESVKVGKYAKDKLKADFALTPEQIKVLDETKIEEAKA